MAITTVDKVKINKYLKEHSIEDICYLGICDAIGKRGKISDIDFLEYFTDCVVYEFRKNEKISIKQLSKVVSIIETFLVRTHEANIEVSEIILDKIRNLKEFYDDYLNRNDFDIDLEFTDNSLESVLKTVQEFYPCDTNSQPVFTYINEIAELNEQIKKLKKEFSDISRLYKKLQDSYAQKSECADTLKEEVVSLENDIRNKTKEISELKEIIESLKEKIGEVETSCSKLQEANDILTPYKEHYERLTIKVEKLLKIVEDDIAEKALISNLEVKQANIETLIYQKLLFERVTIDELLTYVQSRGFTSDCTEIATLLRRMKSKIHIDSSSFSACPTYKIVAPSVLENGEFSIQIPFGYKHYDIMLVSDFHIQEVDHKVLAGFDVLNDYCVKNGIHLILNLGDFYDGFGSKPLEYENAIKNYNVLEQSISLIPKVDGLYHAILGGNHDRGIVYYGFDPLEILAHEREDFLHLGYSHSMISLSNSSSTVGRFDIHHPDTFDFPIHLDDDGINMGNMDNYLQDIYGRQGRNRDESYIDIFGHTHKSQFNYPGSYCYIPSYFEGKNKKGACHLRIYFDEDTNIKYMVFMPLSYNTKLVQNNEIIYQKILSK